MEGRDGSTALFVLVGAAALGADGFETWVRVGAVGVGEDGAEACDGGETDEAGACRTIGWALGSDGVAPVDRSADCPLGVVPACTPCTSAEVALRRDVVGVVGVVRAAGVGAGSSDRRYVVLVCPLDTAALPNSNATSMADQNVLHSFMLISLWRSRGTPKRPTGIRAADDRSAGLRVNHAFWDDPFRVLIPAAQRCTGARLHRRLDEFVQGPWNPSNR